MLRVLYSMSGRRQLAYTFMVVCCDVASEGEKLERAVRGASEAQEDALEAAVCVQG